MSAIQLLDRRVRWIGLLAAFATLFYFLNRQVHWTIDDAYITYRYSENVVRGLGPVYNAGEPVEGYTCFSWMALLAVAGQLGIAVPLAAKAAGMLCVFGSVTLLAFWDHADTAYSRTDAVICALATATTAAFVQWGASGMETAMYCFVAVSVVFSYLQLLRNRDASTAILLGMLGCLLTMTRPNGVVLLGVLFVHALLHRRHLPPKLIATFVVVFGVCYGTYFAWRWSYYGYFLPNTFYAKVGSSGAQLNRGVRYVVSAMPAFGLLIMPVVASWGRPFPPNDESSCPDSRPLLLSLVVAHLTYVIAVGGDNFPAHRFLVVVVPFLWLLAIRALPVLAPAPHRRALLSAVLVGYNFVAASFDPQTRTRIARDYVARDGKAVGRWLAIHTEPDAVIATNSAGALAYYSDRPIVDMLGLNDAEIAHTPVASMGRGKAGHEKGNGFYVLSREPDYVFFGPPKGSTKPMFVGGQELYSLDGFKRRYVYEVAKIDEVVSLHMFRRLSDEELEERKAKAAKKKKASEAKMKKEAQKKAAKKKDAERKRRRKEKSQTPRPKQTEGSVEDAAPPDDVKP